MTSSSRRSVREVGTPTRIRRALERSRRCSRAVAGRTTTCTSASSSLPRSASWPSTSRNGPGLCRVRAETTPAPTARARSQAASASWCYAPTSVGRLSGWVRNLVDEAVVFGRWRVGGDAGPGGCECALDEPGRDRGGDPEAEAAAALVGGDLPGELRLPAEETRDARPQEVVQRRPEQERAVRVELGRDRELE